MAARYRQRAMFFATTASPCRCWRCLLCSINFITKTPWSWNKVKTVVKILDKDDNKTVSCLFLWSTIFTEREEKKCLKRIKNVVRESCCKLPKFDFTRSEISIRYTSGEVKKSEVKRTCNLKIFQTGVKFHVGVSFTSVTCNNPPNLFCSHVAGTSYLLHTIF